ncbi:DEAD/DEAH box helicase [Histidinibacterium lentulum]|uniref:DEAD/DEAH box helicase n=1 Tax=Histidinibacterium lentulum TaxID=2480588 RepID=A0A3N2R7Q9_9RHOB|nr:DEAD/DEAH box helicase [Histidinibacterium lentulum]ROU03443.1 DEAD/DEAH box helicase [Histidinibacterium lentulum]
MIQTLSDALAERGYDALTPVQEAVTDPALRDADLLVSAQTGSGKTVGFGLAIGPTLLGEEATLGPAAAPLALIVAPTRELAFQVMRELAWLYAKAGAQVASCVGGMDMRDERRALERGAHIVVGTPGRLRDHIQRGSLDMSALRAVVLDEADEMLDLGFREDLEFMLGEAPPDRRTLLFSATVPPMIATLAKHYQRDAVRVTTLSDRSQHADIAYQALRVAQHDAENAIMNVLRYHEARNAIVFANTRAAVNRLAARFSNRGFSVVSLSGELSQTERSHALQAMRDGRARVCVATDVAARGIDLPNLELVIHAELPTNAEGLLHRSGRTGRAGRKGISALIVTPKALRRAERLLASAHVTADWTTAPGADEIRQRDEERLLADPLWSEEISEEQATFAAKLLSLHTPETIAAAYLKLYQSRHSAPEDLAPPDAPMPEKPRGPFGPGVWFRLSVGRDDRAEARWLLPLLCRAGRLDKTDIGAIRVQQSETFVELLETSVPGFLKALGPEGLLEKGVTARRMDAAPDTGPAPARPRPEPRAPRPAPEAAAPTAAPVAAPPAPEAEAKAPAAEPARADTPRRDKARTDTPRTDKPHRDKPRSDKPRSDKPPRSGDKPKKPWSKDRPAADGGPQSHAPRRGPGKPKTDARPPYASPKPAAPRADASDTSKRFVPPGAKPAGKPGKPRQEGGRSPVGKPGYGKAPGGKPRSGKPGGPKRGAGGGQPPKRRS